MHRTPFHPLAVLGYRRDGRPIYPIAGGSGEGDGGAGQSGQLAGDPAGSPAPQATGQSGDPSGQPPENAPQDVSSLPDWAQKLIADTRREAAGHRTAKTAAEQRATEAEQQKQAVLDAIAEATGKGPRSANDPETLRQTVGALTGERDTLATELRTARAELAVYKAATQHGADPDLLAAVLHHGGHLTKLDPTADDFEKSLADLVKQTVDTNPKLRAGQAPLRGGSEFTGGPTPTSAADKAAPGLDRLRAAYSSQ